MKEIINCNIAVIGGGVVGLATALELQQAGHETILIEKNSLIGDEVSSRNSGVIHSGIYYPPHSLKAQLTFKGNQFLYEYAHKNDVPVQQVGKIIYGHDKDQDRLNALIKNGEANGVQGLSLLDHKEIKELEPNLNENITTGIFSKFTGIIDVPLLMASYAKNFESLGGVISKNSKCLESSQKFNKHHSLIQTGEEQFWLDSDKIIFATGLHSFNNGQNISSIKHSESLKKINYSKGHYYKISGNAPFQHLIYPLPDSHGLGIHYTLDLSGAAKFGPDVEFIDNIDLSFSQGSMERFRNSIKNYWPEVIHHALQEDYVGVRPKIQMKDEPFADFSFLTYDHHGSEGLIFMQGIESPGLTCSLAIAKYIREKLDL